MWDTAVSADASFALLRAALTTASLRVRTATEHARGAAWAAAESVGDEHPVSANNRIAAIRTLVARLCTIRETMTFLVAGPIAQSSNVECSSVRRQPATRLCESGAGQAVKGHAAALHHRRAGDIYEDLSGCALAGCGSRRRRSAVVILAGWVLRSWDCHGSWIRNPTRVIREMKPNVAVPSWVIRRLGRFSLNPSVHIYELVASHSTQLSRFKMRVRGGAIRTNQAGSLPCSRVHNGRSRQQR